MCNNTHVIPFRLTFQPGLSLYEQVVYAAKKAVVSGHLRPGDPFPSVRALSTALKINPNTAHKVVTHLIAEGMLEAKPGIGTVVAEAPEATRSDLTRLLDRELEQVVVEAMQLGLHLPQVSAALAAHWRRLEPVKTQTGVRRS
ncbi:MAG: GntR family transcriptional regulator [Acidobacteriia bacterium]|nr:GntR family transcriptional regulator [Terriglobia bacterium]